MGNNVNTATVYFISYFSQFISYCISQGLTPKISWTGGYFWTGEVFVLWTPLDWVQPKKIKPWEKFQNNVSTLILFFNKKGVGIIIPLSSFFPFCMSMDNVISLFQLSHIVWITPSKTLQPGLHLFNPRWNVLTWEFIYFFLFERTISEFLPCDKFQKKFRKVENFKPYLIYHNFIIPYNCPTREPPFPLKLSFKNWNSEHTITVKSVIVHYLKFT